VGRRHELGDEGAAAGGARKGVGADTPPAGVVVAALAVPQSLGYASIAGVPVQVGLYAVPIALLVYAVIGSSPQLIVGPVSTVSVLSATLVASMHPANAAQAVTYTSAIALAAGAVLVLAGFLRVGWVAEFLSKPIVTGFVFGLTILVIIGELPNLLGIPSRRVTCSTGYPGSYSISTRSTC